MPRIAIPPRPRLAGEQVPQRRFAPGQENGDVHIHPSLLPSFGGKGCHGAHVHQAVLDAGCKVSGCTVHLATNEYDRGPILVQKAVPVLPDDNASTLAARVFAAECEAYPENQSVPRPPVRVSFEALSAVKARSAVIAA